MATKWLDSAGVVTVVLCAFIFMYLEPWHVVQIFFRKKNLKKRGWVGLSCINRWATGWLIFIRVKRKNSVSGLGSGNTMSTFPYSS